MVKVSKLMTPPFNEYQNIIVSSPWSSSAKQIIYKGMPLYIVKRQKVLLRQSVGTVVSMFLVTASQNTWTWSAVTKKDPPILQLSPLSTSPPVKWTISHGRAFIINTLLLLGHFGISVLMTYQFGWHFYFFYEHLSFNNLSVLVTFQFARHFISYLEELGLRRV